MKLQSMPGMACMGIIMALFVLAAISCSKNSSGPAAPTGFPDIANQLQGEILNGSVLTESGEDGIALWCNGGKVLIGIGKIPSQEFTDPGNIEHAQVIYSSSGIIIRDTDTNKFWYYIQNDKNSQTQFQSLQPAGEKPIVSGITGTIKINVSQPS